MTDLDEHERALAEIQRLRADRGMAEWQRDGWIKTAGILARERDEARAELASARQELRACREQLDDARSIYGDKLCPRCSVQVTAEAAAEQAGDTP